MTINKTLSLVLCSCKTWSFTFREEQRLRLFENRVLRKIFGSKREEQQGNGEDCTMRSVMICTPYQILLG
jgi:hypothetical protein